MHIKMRHRYYCDFCSKSGGSNFHMGRHEKSCTANPKRECKMCVLGGMDQKPVADLIAALRRDIDRHEEETKDLSLERQLASIQPEELRLESDGCPACMLAAIRQTTPRPPVNFEYLEEVKSFMNGVNEDRTDY